MAIPNGICKSLNWGCMREASKGRGGRGETPLPALPFALPFVALESSDRILYNIGHERK